MIKTASDKAYESYVVLNGFEKPSEKDAVTLTNTVCEKSGRNLEECITSVIDQILQLFFDSIDHGGSDDFMQQVRQEVKVQSQRDMASDSMKYRVYWRGAFASVNEKGTPQKVEVGDDT